MKPNSPYSLRMFSMPLRSLSVEKTSPSPMPNSGRISDFGRAEQLHADEVHVVAGGTAGPLPRGCVMSAAMPGIVRLEQREPPAVAARVRMI